MEYNHIGLEGLGNAVVKLTLKRPDKRNALNRDMMNELCKAVEELQFSECRVILLAGEGKCFCSGLDLEEASDESLSDSIAEHISRLFTVMYNTRLVTIALVQGDAFAGGAGLAAACDFVLISPQAKIGFPETRRGLVAAIVAAVLIRRIEPRAMRELMLTGEAVDCNRAVELGLATRIVKAEALDKEARALADKILLGGPEAVKATKRLIVELTPGDFTEDLRKGLDIHKESRHTKEAQEGITSYLEKRTPAWL